MESEGKSITARLLGGQLKRARADADAERKFRISLEDRIETMTEERADMKKELDAVSLKHKSVDFLNKNLKKEIEKHVANRKDQNTLLREQERKIKALNAKIKDHDSDLKQFASRVDAAKAASAQSADASSSSASQRPLLPAQQPEPASAVAARPQRRAEFLDVLHGMHAGRTIHHSTMAEWNRRIRQRRGCIDTLGCARCGGG